MDGPLAEFDAGIVGVGDGIGGRVVIRHFQ